jgi:predicted MPP superfamily phosphohydrolase
LILGGDYVFLDVDESIGRRLSRWVSAIPARTKVAVMGNHDLWTRHELIEDALRQGGATVLVNESMMLPPPHSMVAVVGLDDPKTGRPDPEQAFAAKMEGSVAIAVCHSSDPLDEVQRHGAALFVTGHTHGGQIALPGSIPIIVPGRHGRRYPAGLHHVDNLHLFVSRGVGGVELPVRAFARPDVAALTLTPASASVGSPG